MKIVAIIQAHMGSTRLPGKVLLDLAGEPMLVRDMNRLSRAQALDEVVVATTIESADNAIVSLCDEYNWPCFRGSEEDVLDPYYCAAVDYEADVVVRITSDCPLKMNYPAASGRGIKRRCQQNAPRGGESNPKRIQLSQGKKSDNNATDAVTAAQSYGVSIAQGENRND